MKRDLEKRPYQRIKHALSVAEAAGDTERADRFRAELKRREGSTRRPTPLTPMAPIPGLDPCTEQWLPVPVGGFADRYEVSSFGRLRSRRGRIYSAKLRRNERYIMVVLGRPKSEGGSVTWRLHRLVAGAFVENPGNLPEVNHKDCDRLNNHASNLEWVTREENIAHSTASGRNTASGNPNKIRKVSSEDAAAIRAALTGSEHPYDIAKRYGIDSTTVERINQNVSHAHDPSAQTHVPVKWTPRPRPPAKRPTTARNKQIAAERAAGLSCADLGRKYGLTYRRIWTIVDHERRNATARDDQNTERKG